MRTGVLSFLAIMVLRAVSVAAPPDPQLFPRPAAIEPQIRFWKAIFTEHSTHQVVLHDALYLDKVYKVLDFRREAAGMDSVELERLKREVTDLEMERVRRTLLRLHELGPNPQGLDSEEAAVYALWADDRSPDRFLEAAGPKRLRSQRGLRERFAEGLRESRRWFPEMEATFPRSGSAGRADAPAAHRVLLQRAGVLEGRRRRHLAVHPGHRPALPARRQPRRRAARRARVDAGAARYLRELHDDLGSWPLAITSYNHGPVGISRAVDEVGSRDIATIIRRYDGNAFGFASRNFYPEFLPRSTSRVTTRPTSATCLSAADRPARASAHPVGGHPGRGRAWRAATATSSRI
jgi:membrane-bound lytic murein transglycosylase D